MLFDSPIFDKEFTDETFGEYSKAHIDAWTHLGCSFNNVQFKKHERHISLTGHNFLYCTFVNCDFSNCDLSKTDFDKSQFYNCNFQNADCDLANFERAKFFNHNYFSNARLESANFHAAFFEGGCVFTGATVNKDTCFLRSYGLEAARDLPDYPFQQIVPDTGSFIGWKKVNANRQRWLVKLRILEDARRSNAVGRKCRCDKAEVLDIVSLETGEHIKEVTNTNITKLIYKVGEIVYPDDFNPNRFEECTNGIHFFITKQEAIDY